ncbi:MAG: hypothetical protein KBS86_02160 [Proteobacteria bacterium]|nr:hypothetical protein [Candidatus Enterousia scatequi]
MPRKKKTDEFLPPDPENEALSNLAVFVDTRNLMPGMVVYTVVPTPPTNKIPYVVYNIEPRIITQIHDSGVNGGTIFITYTHYVSNAVGNDKQIQIKCEEETLYSPLTKEHAEYVAKKLTEQSKALYMKYCEQNQQSR